ncbi:galactose mutarotase-like enzyme [Rhizobium sp. BK529]|uniref:hypothetical protein n=1 Tax=unclassified Rhizobium TaxID=2613769 RepID=UPI0017E7995A|nr:MULTISPECIES: hypothetical protein [unclassified Rhizobium]MBB3595056.1 galactose mutarotase-like enzyme [Rhizobium sp. BK529]
MPFQFGFHPGFAWPLPGAQGQPHSIELDGTAEPRMLRLDAAGLMLEQPLPSPFRAGRLEISASHFERGAMIFADGAGTRFTYSAPTAEIELSATNLPVFSVWQKPGAPFLCLEPWHGMPPFPIHGAALINRSGCKILRPHARAQFSMDLRFKITRS